MDEIISIILSIVVMQLHGKYIKNVDNGKARHDNGYRGVQKTQQ